jgi:hypothetical protein
MLLTMSEERVALTPSALSHFFLSRGVNVLALGFSSLESNSIIADAAFHFLGSKDRRHIRKIYYFWRRNKEVRLLFREGCKTRASQDITAPINIDDKKTRNYKSWQYAARWSSRKTLQVGIPPNIVAVEELLLENNTGHERGSPDCAVDSKPVLVRAQRRRRLFTPAGSYEGEFHFNREEWENIFQNGSLVQRKWTNVLYSKFFSINVTCVLLVHSHRYRWDNTIVVRAYCKHENCKKFQLVIDNRPCKDVLHIPVLVYSQGNVNHGENKLCRPLSGSRRVEAREILKKEKSLLFRSRAIREANEDAVMQGNIESIHSLDVLRKARQEAKDAEDLDRDYILDVFKMALKERKDGESYIQHVEMPLGIHCFSPVQIRVLSSLQRGNRPILYFDATGSVVRRHPCFRKRVLYYTGVIKVNNIIVPVMELLTESHDAASILCFLIRFRNFA